MEHLSPASYVEKHVLNGSGETIPFPIGKNVVLNIQKATEDVLAARRRWAQSQVLADYKWENKASYRGRIIAARNQFLAYRLFNETTGEAVRVLHRETKARHLIKDFRQSIVDLQWAAHAPFLAVVDASANIYIYHMEEGCKTVTKYLNIICEEEIAKMVETGSSPNTEGDSIPKLAWCPFMDAEEGAFEEDFHLLGLAQGSQVFVFFLHFIKTALPRLEVKLAQVREIPDAVLHLELESTVTAIKLSPDGTAMAIGTTDGFVSFYVIDTDRIRFANRLKAVPEQHLIGGDCCSINEIVFLDDLKTKNHEQFWKYVVVSVDNGHRVLIYDCDNWQCLGKLRFSSIEPSALVGHLELSIDPTARFLFLIDYDTSQLYCLEIGYISTVPCFASCAQVALGSTLIACSPCDLLDTGDNAGNELSLDEEENEEPSNSNIRASFIAISHRSVLELTADLQSHPAHASSLWGAVRSPVGAQPASPQPLERGVKEEELLHVESSSPLPTAPPRHSAEVVKPIATQQTEAGNGAAHASPFTATTVPAATDRAVIMADPSQSIANTLGLAIRELCEKVDGLSAEVTRLQQENLALRNEQNDNLSNALEKISTELKYRDGVLHETLERSMRALNQESRDHLLHAVEATLSRNTLGLQALAEQTQQRTSDSLRQTLAEALVPAIEGMCTQIFQQMNESFRDGLSEFLEQMTANVHRDAGQDNGARVALNSIVDQTTSTLLQLIHAGQLPQALELATSQRDSAMVMLVCSKVDSDSLFTAGAPYKMETLLSVLQHLSQKLESDTDLKFRFIEGILLHMNSINPAASRSNELFRITMEQLARTFDTFTNTELCRQSAAYKRQTRIIRQFISNLLR